MTRLSALALVVLAATAQAQSPAYLDHVALTRELRTLVNGSRSAKMTSLGTTIGGREIWVVESPSSNKYQMRSCISLTKERSAAIRAEPAVHSIAAVRDTREVARLPDHLESRSAKGSIQERI